MPMATPELAAKFEDDGEAWQVLKQHGWTMIGFMLIPSATDYRPEGREADAVDYMCDEWDYGYDP